MNLKQEYTKHKPEIEAGLQEFSQLSDKEHIKELFFCILTPQSNAEKCWQAVKELEKCELTSQNAEKIKTCLKTRTRFHNNKARYIVEASKNWREIEKLISTNNNPKQVRELLVKNINGLGMKEASHFLRNIGKSNNELAILDRHVLRQLKKLNIVEDDMIKNNKDYLKKEEKMKKFSRQVSIPLDALDLLFWKLESGRIFK